MTLTPLNLRACHMRATRHGFDVLPTLDGWDVIAVDTGRPVDHRAEALDARARAHELNAATGSKQTFITAMGANSNPSDALSTRCAGSRQDN